MQVQDSAISYQLSAIPPQAGQESERQYLKTDDRELKTENWVYGFELGDYDPRYTLVIDPGLQYSTFLGGGDFEEGSGIALDSSGNAISLTNDPTGAFFIYRIDVNTFNNNDFWDFPQLGMDQDAVIVTANIFGPTSYRTTRMFAVAKARLYNGLAFSVPLHTGLVGTLVPPIVLDQDNRAFLVAAPTSGTTVRKYTLSNASNPTQQTLTSVLIPVASYTTPPDATQPGTTNLLDTLDARFVNASTQIGTSLWQVHTINSGGRPRPRWYQFNTATNAITQSGTFGESSVSHDWNASIVANTANTAVFVTWSSTKTGTGAHHARVRFSGRRSTDTAGVIAAGGSLVTSTTFYDPSSSTVERWGDYSAVTIDPTNGLRAWIVNEKINSASVWGTRIGQIGY